MKRALVSLFVASVVAMLAACGSSDSGTAIDDSDIVSLYVDTFEDLPNCSKNREGDLAEVQDTREAYRCLKGVWEFDHDVLDSVMTEDDLPACTDKKEGASLFVQREHAAYTCDGKRWTKVEKKSSGDLDEYENEDDLPNCTSKRSDETAVVEGEVYRCSGTRWEDVGAYYATEDSLSNCTSKREGEKAFIADTKESLVCKDGAWNDGKSSGDSKESKSSSSSGSSSGKPSSGTSGSSPSGDSSDSSSGTSSKSSSSSVKVPEPAEGTMIDSRDGQTYKTVVIGTQTWMAENLNYSTTASWCPLQKSSYCEKYGRLYYYDDVTSTLCPDGWHLPSLSEWQTLLEYVDEHNGSEGIGKSLKSTMNWMEEGDMSETRVAVATGKDSFGFSAQPAGSCWWGSPWKCYSDDETRIWTREGRAYKITFDSDMIVLDDEIDKDNNVRISVRCLKGLATNTTTTSPSSVAKKEITGCACGGKLSTETNDLASDNPVEYTWSVTGCSSEGAEPLSYIWSGSVSGTKSSVTASYTKKGEYTPSVTVTNADGNTKDVTCPSAYVVDSDNPYDEIEFPANSQLGPGGYYIPKCTEEWEAPSITLAGGSSDDCLDWIDNQQVTWGSHWGDCGGNIQVEFPLYITIPAGEYMSFQNCY